MVCLAFLVIGCEGGENTTPGIDDGKADSWRDTACESPPPFFTVSASSVEGLGGDLSSLTPACAQADNSHDCEYYLETSSCLGDYGPLGAYGPLGMLGPVGDNVWNPSYWISAAGDWSEWSESMSLDGGPLSEAGPLGPSGPLGDEAYFETLPAINDWARQLQAGGVWTVLGPFGPTGPLGPLGPLGPIGAHGFASDADGNWIRSGDNTAIRTLEVPWENTTREYELVEMYPEEFAAGMTDNDTSAMITGGISSSDMDTPDRFQFTSRHMQFVTILLTPEAQLDDFDLVIMDLGGQELARSNSEDYIDWVQLLVPEGMQFEVEVWLAGSGHYFSKNYRLYVTGSTEHFPETYLCGQHQVPYTPPPLADAGESQTVTSGSSVNLDGTGSRNHVDGPLSFGWSQLSGPEVDLSDYNGATPSFTAPPATEHDAVLVFELSVNNLVRTVDDTVEVVVHDPSNEWLVDRYGNYPYLPIPDGDGSLVSTIAVEGYPGQQVSAGHLLVDIGHRYPRDLLVELVTPDGTTLTFWDHSSGDYGDNGVHIDEDLADLAGESLDGLWQLIVTDDRSIGEGTLNEWRLQLQ